MALGVNSASDSLGILMYGEEILLQYSNNYLKTPPTPANSLFLESFVFLRKKCNDTECPWAINLLYLRSSMVQFELSMSNDGKKRSGGNPRGFGLGDLVTVVSLINNVSVGRF